MLNVAAAVIVKENKILITQRAKEDSFPLKWEFLGGKLEEGDFLKMQMVALFF